MSGSADLQKLSAGLERLNSYTLPEFKEAVETLLIYTKNLIDHPDDKRFRAVKKANIHFQERLGRFDGCTEAMNAVGFFEQGDYLRLVPELTEERQNLLREMRNVMNTRREEASKMFESLPVRLAEDHKYSSVVAAAAHGEIGRRADMEDDEIMIDAFGNTASTGFFALYDGHGGRQSVDFVVKTLHLTLEQELAREPDLPLAEAFERAYLMTDGQLRRHNILRSGTTAVTCVLREETRAQEEAPRRMLYTANVGDSRAILCRNGQAIRLTIDHKATLPEEAKRVRDAGGYIGNNKRVNGILAISRALGDHMLKENNVVSAVPYCTTTELNAETDKFLLLACDGVWDVMSDQDAIDFVLAQYETTKAQAGEEVHENAILKTVAQALITKALELRSYDNISVVFVRL